MMRKSAKPPTLKAPYVVKALSVLLQKLEMQDDEFDEETFVDDRLETIREKIRDTRVACRFERFPNSHFQAMKNLHEVLEEIVDLIALLDWWNTEAAKSLAEDRAKESAVFGPK